MHQTPAPSIGEDVYADPPPAYDQIGPSAPSDQAASGCVVRDTQRRRSFGIGGAGNIRTTNESAVVALSAALDHTRHHRTGSPPNQPSSGASDLRDRIVDGVRTILGRNTVADAQR